jgi:serine/threonine protein kinase
MDNMLSSLPDAEKFFVEGGMARLPVEDIAKSLNDSPGPLENVDGLADRDEFIGKSVGNYKLLQKIGEGGCGAVYLAEQEEPVRRKVAFKVIKLGMDTKNVIARFEAERQALALMNHPNIARVLDAGAMDTGRPYFVMELVSGVKVTEYCDRNELDTRRRLELFIQVCKAIQHAHQKGVIHRDIKPSNILITNIDGKPVPKVIDFGIAKAIEGRLADDTIFTPYEHFIGTPAYMSPEQAVVGGLDVDTRSDVYSLGVLLYELLTGRTPFESKELMEKGIDNMRRTLQEREPQRPSVMVTTMQETALTQLAHLRHSEPLKFISLLQGDLDWIVIRCLEKNRTRRYETANGLALDVQRYLNDEPIFARPPSRLYRLQKLVQRNKTTFVAIAAVGCALVAGFGTSTWLFFREREARQQQVQLRQEAECARAGEQQLRNEADARAVIAQAALLLNRNETAASDQLVDKIQVPVVEASLEAAGVFRKLGEWNVLQGQWKAAADRFSKLVRANQVDKADKTDQATWDLLRTAPALIAAGDMDRYHRFVKESLDHFSGTTDPVAAEQVVKISLLVPADATTIRELQPFANALDQSMAGKNPLDPANGYLFSWRDFSLCLFCYRSGDYANAVIWGERSFNYSSQTPSRVAMTQAVLAMAYAKLGLPDQSRQQVDAARKSINEKLPNGLDNVAELGTFDTGFWHDWVIGYLLLHEAEETVK